MDKLERYKKGLAPLPRTNRLWPLYGAGFENLGLDNRPIEAPMPALGPDELLVRHDACGLCFSDIKVIKLGEEHPRIYRRMRENPVVLGHEVCMTVVGVGDNLRDQYRIGDRFVIQADIYVNGVGYAYGYEIQGGLSQYNVIDQRILNGDHGNYLIPVQPSTGYAESALTEPWACVIAAYHLEYRTSPKPAGVMWIIGAAGAPDIPFTLSAGLDGASHPRQLLLTNVPETFSSWLHQRAEHLHTPIIEVPDLSQPPVTPVDDIIVLGADPDLIELVSPHLADFGICAIIGQAPMPRKVSVDVGRIHYSRWLYVGGRGPDIAEAYLPAVRSALTPGGRAWFVGAGGPMGRMHVQHALQQPSPPSVIVCTERNARRRADLRETFQPEMQARGIHFVCINPEDPDDFRAGMAPFAADGFDDIIVLAPVASIIEGAAEYLAKGGTMNIFAGVPRGTMAQLDLSPIYLYGSRIIGHSASSIDDLRRMLHETEAGVLSPNSSVAAVGSLSAAKDGLKAVVESRFPGKIVIFPNIREFPLTGLPELKDVLPSVYAKLKNGREWTVEAEDEFLRILLPEE
ncbi:MAG: alcohol dehydrogenase catalytic domain-containing protein [Anaerolineae bacterium]